jgi:hypothetical protein
MESYLITKFGDKYATTTLRKRVSFLTQLANGATDIRFLNDTKRILEKLNSYSNPSTRWTLFMHIVEAMKIDPSLITPETRKIYDDAITKLKPNYTSHVANNVKTERETKLLDTTLPKQQELLKKAISDHFEKYHVPYKPLTEAIVKKLGAGFIQFASGLQDLTYLSAYLFQPALRSNYASMRITTKAVNDKEHNYLFKRGRHMIIKMRKYKNSKSFGDKDITVRPDFAEVLNIWLSTLKYLLKIKKMPEHLIHYSISSNGVKWIGNDDSLARNIPRISERILGRDYNIDGFRKLWETHIQRSDEYAEYTREKRNAVHAEMLHTPYIAELYNRKNPDQ